MFAIQSHPKYKWSAAHVIRLLGFRVKVYFMESGPEENSHNPRILGQLPSLLNLPETFKAAELELYLYFPLSSVQTWRIGGTPWKIRQKEVEVLQAKDMWRCSTYVLYIIADADGYKGHVERCNEIDTAT